jgi:hypothetical protein
MEEIHRAEQAAAEAGETEQVARGAEKPYLQRVQQVAVDYPSPVITVLGNLGLIVGSASWDGVVRVTGMTKFGELVLEDLHRSSTEAG